MAETGGTSTLEESSERMRALPEAQPSEPSPMPPDDYDDDPTKVAIGLYESGDPRDVILPCLRRISHIRGEALEVLHENRVFYVMFDEGKIPDEGHQIDLQQRGFFSDAVQAELLEINTAQIKNGESLVGFSPGQLMPMLRDPRCGKDSFGQPLIRFQLLERLGAGSFARVYSAHDGLLDRDVTLKVMEFRASHDESDDVRTQVIRMVLEAHTLQTIDHPQAARLYDDFACVSPDGAVFAMDGHYGESLASLLKKGYQFSEQEVLSICIVISDVLRHMHHQGLLHRDIKPSNVLKDLLGIKVVDFGNVFGGREPLRIGQKTHLHHLALGYESSPDFFGGTPQYMPPESLFDPADGNTPARDMYALGVTAYHLIEGRVPFTASLLKELLVKVERQAPPPIEREDISPVLKAFVMQLLSKKPGGRPTAEEAHQFFTRRRIANVLNGSVLKGCMPEFLARLIHSCFPQRWLDAMA